jgi:hypothetical protein
MTDKPKKLSDTARALLTSAAMRDDHLIRPPRLPVAAARQVIRSLLNAGWAEEVPAPIDDAAYAWRTGEDGEVLMLRATVLGLAGVAEQEGTAAAPISTEATIEIAVEMAAPTRTEVAGAVTAAAPITLDLVASAASPGPDDADGAATVPAAPDATASPEATLPMPQRARRADFLRLTAQAVLNAWDTRAESDPEIVEVMVGPLAALSYRPSRKSVNASLDRFFASAEGNEAGPSLGHAHP